MRTALQSNASTLCRHYDGPVLIIHTFRRKSFDWLPIEHAIEFTEETSAEHWVDHIQSILDRQPDRPDRLFVVINPYGGNQRADDVWREVTKPIFERAHITCDAFRTGFQDHAVQLIEQMPWEQFSSYDGIVAIGGDGLFQECLRGVLALRARGAQWRAKAKDIRIAQVPAGSTDAVACTINGCRSAVTAALHVVIGDRSKLDVLEVRTKEGQCRYACSTASYGFIGDVLGQSELMRWMGPARYDVGGAMTLLRLRSYPVRLWYKAPAAPHPVRRICCSDCQLCSQPTSNSFDDDLPLSMFEGSVTGDDGSPAVRTLSTSLAPPSSPTAAVVTTTSSESNAEDAAAVGGPQRGFKPALRGSLHMRGASGFGEHALMSGGTICCEHSAQDETASQATVSDAWFRDLQGEGEGAAASSCSGEDTQWRCWEGEISSLMVVVTPTRSDKSKSGIVPHAHLSDGRLHLVIVRKCTRMQFFRFLLSLSQGGVDERLDFVEVKEVESWRLEQLNPAGGASVWNVDGELMKTHFMSARCHHGLVQVFGRGPECPSAAPRSTS
jgi:diacylglycerol kinase family enzyme